MGRAATPYRTVKAEPQGGDGHRYSTSCASARPRWPDASRRDATACRDRDTRRCCGVCSKDRILDADRCQVAGRISAAGA